MMGRLMRDADGRESRTLLLVTISWLVVTGKFLIAGLTLPFIGMHPPVSLTEYGAAVAAILAIWLGREWVKKG